MKHPHFQFIKYITNFIDAQTYYGKVFLIEQQTGLSKVALNVLNKSICKVEQMSNWERRPLRKSQAHYASLDAYILIGIIEKLVEKAKQDGLQPFEKFVKTLDTRNIIVNEVIDNADDFYENESKRLHKMNNEKLNVEHNQYANKKRDFKKNYKYEESKSSEQGGGGNKAYGNSYGRKGQTNNTQLFTNDELRASMWQTHGFVVDKNLNKLARMLQEKSIDCVIPDTTDSEKICSLALEKNRILITSNLKLFNRKNAMNRCCVHYKDSPQKQFMALKSFFSFDQ